MKKLIFIVLLVISSSAYAGMWTLINQHYEGSGWLCTYQLQGTNYQTTIFSQNVCQYNIFN